jgi:hypothetical protein
MEGISLCRKNGDGFMISFGLIKRSTAVEMSGLVLECVVPSAQTTHSPPESLRFLSSSAE